MNTINTLARSRLRYNRSGTLLTAIAFVLTTCLLMAVSSMGIGIYRSQKEIMLHSNLNSHATYLNVTPDQLEVLKRHLEVEALTTTEVYAGVEYEKMNATLRCDEVLLSGINGSGLTEGRFPEAAEEIAGPPAFFQRLGYESPAVGDTVEIPHRVLGKGEIVSGTFVICGLMEQVDLSEYDVADTRIAYSARVSGALMNTLDDADRKYRAAVRITGEDTRSRQEMEDAINRIAADIGLAEDDVSINDGYLMWVTDPGTEVIVIVAGICILVAAFAALVIYSIYYVAIITNVQELGKLKALGATRRQMKSLLLREGLLTALCAMPAGLGLGYLLAAACMKLMITLYWPEGAAYRVSLFSLPVLLVVIAVVMLTALLSMLRPMGLVAKISPMEAIRYQEKGTGRQASRKGYPSLSVGRLSAANMSRNRRRTAITIATMGLGGILFLFFAGIISSQNELDYVRHYLTKGEFMIDLRYSTDDATYLENNLDALQETDILGPGLLREIEAIPGVTRVETGNGVLALTDHPDYNEGRCFLVSAFNREDAAAMELRQGDLDYDAMVVENGIILSYDSNMERYGFQLGDVIRFTLFDGTQPVAFEGRLTATTGSGHGHFALPEEVLARYVSRTNPADRVYVWVEGGHEGAAYGSVKTALRQIVESSSSLTLMSMDEELGIARTSMQALSVALYLVIAVLGIVSFLNLINTMVTSIVTRRREIGTLQALGLTNRQLGQMLWREGLVFTGGALFCALTVGNLLGYLGFLFARENGLMGITHYHYPLTETIVMTVLLVAAQFIVTRLLSRYAHRDYIVQRIRQ